MPPTPNCPAVLCSCLLSQPFYKGVPGIVFQPIGLKLSLSNQSWAAISHISIFTDQSEWLHSDQASDFGTNQIRKFGVLICVRTDQSGTRGRDFSLYKSAPLCPGESIFPFHPRLKTLFPWLKTSCWTRAEQSRAEQSRWTGPEWSRAV